MPVLTSDNKFALVKRNEQIEHQLAIDSEKETEKRRVAEIVKANTRSILLETVYPIVKELDLELRSFSSYLRWKEVKAVDDEISRYELTIGGLGKEPESKFFLIIEHFADCGQAGFFTVDDDKKQIVSRLVWKNVDADMIREALNKLVAKALRLA